MTAWICQDGCHVAAQDQAQWISSLIHPAVHAVHALLV